jgi:hypothetical protein
MSKKAEYIDQLSMLLSADWFRDHWRVVGLDVRSDQKRRDLCAKSKSIVDDLIGAADAYWNVDFAGQRLARTKRLVKGALSEAVGDREAVDVLTAIEQVRSNAKANSLASNLTERLVANRHDPGEPILSDEVRDKVAKHWKEAASEGELDFEEIEAKSMSEWDVKLRALTPGQDTYLVDYLIAGLLAPLAFARFWQRMRTVLGKTELLSLANWYRTIGKTRANVDLELTTR